MPGRQLVLSPSVTTPTNKPPGSHRRKRTLRSDIRDGNEDSNNKKRPRITPSPFSLPPLASDVTNNTEVDRLVASVSQSPQASDSILQISPRRSPRLKSRPQLSNVAVAVRSKQKVSAFKLDGKAIYAWFRDDLDPAPSATSPSSLKQKAQNNFGRIQYKRQLNNVEAGKSRRIAHNSKSNKPKSKTRKSKEVSSLPDCLLPSIETTNTIESNSYRRYLIEDFLFTNVGDHLLLQIALDHPQVAAYSTLYHNSAPKPLRHTSGRTFFQLPCVVTHHSRRAELVAGTLDRREVRHLLFENGNGSIGVSIATADTSVTSEIFIFWNEVFSHPNTFEVWGHAPANRSFRLLFKDGLTSPDSRQRVFNRLAVEVNNDRSLSFDVSSAFAKVIDATTKKVEAKAKVVLKKDIIFDAGISLSLDQDTIKPISEYCNSIILEEVTRCYGTFVSLTDPIIPDTKLDLMANKLYDTAPAIAASIQKFLGYDGAMKRKRYRHMLKFYRRMTLFQVMALSRVRNPKNFSWWGVIGSAIAYGQKETDASKRMTNFFGHSLHTTTLLEKLAGFMKAEYLYETAFPLIRAQSVTYSEVGENDLLEEKTAFVSLSVFDNSQMNFPFKFQRGNKTSNYVRVTSRLYIDVWQGAWQKKKQPVDRVAITYCDQAIPSPFFMPPYEHSVASYKVMGCVNYPRIVSDDAGVVFPDIDVTGKRVKGYLHHLHMANEFIGQQKYLSTGRPYKFQPQEYGSVENMAFRDVVTDTLSRNAKKGRLYNLAYSFQQRAVLSIRGDRPKAKLLVLPVAKDDETTKKGIGATMLKLWHCSGLLSKVSEEEFGYAWKAASLEDKRYIIKIGDGLSYERMRNYSDLIEDDTKSYIRYHAQVEELRKAMDRTMIGSGDLHIRGFHALGPVYATHHPGLIQPIQIALGWKRIEHSKVEKCYEQAAFLVLLILNECERQLYDAFLFQMDLEERATLLLLVENEEAMAEYIAHAFPKWMTHRLIESTDEDFKRILNFVKMARKYRFGRQSMQNGCAIATEWGYLDFAPAWLVLGKNICFEIALRQVEELYSKAPFWLLQTMRDNRFATLHSSSDYNGRAVSHHPLDDIIENLQAKLKQMSLGRTDAAWMRHSTNVSLAQRCSTFVRHNFGRRSDVESFEKWAGGKADEIDIGRVKKQSTAPKRTATKQLICEILTLSKICVETPGRKADVNRLWSILPELSTELTDEEKIRGSTSLNRSQEDRELENLSSQIVDGELEVSLDDAEEVAATSNHNDENLTEDVTNNAIGEEDDLGQAVARFAQDNDHDYNDDEDRDDDNDQAVVTEEGEKTTELEVVTEVDVVVGKKEKRKVKVKRLALHRMAIPDIFEVGSAKMITINLPATRHRAKQRRKRERVALHDNLRSFLDNLGNNFEIEIAKIDPSQAVFLSRRRQLADKIRSLL
jgi:hypothetical protein